MQNSRSVSILAALMLTLVAFICNSQPTASEKVSIQRAYQEESIESLISAKNRDERFWAAWNLRGQREELVRKLIAILNTNYSDNVKMDALIVLGDYHASEAIPFLVQHLELDDAPHEKVSKAVLFARIPDKVIDALENPVSVALEKIGMPAVQALLEKITQSDDSKIVRKCVSICRNIEGQEVTQFRLEGLLKKETDSKMKDRLQSALDALKKLNPEK